MCYFITIAVPKDKSEIVEKSVPRGLHIGATSNPTITKHLPDNMRLYLIMSGGCSCDLFSESGKGEWRGTPSDRAAKLRQKYRQKGWSAVKIERAVLQAVKDAGGHTGPVEAGLRSDVREYFFGLLPEVKEIKIYVEWYDGNVESEEISVKQGPRINGHQLRVDNFVNDKGTIYTVTQ